MSYFKDISVKWVVHTIMMNPENKIHRKLQSKLIFKTINMPCRPFVPKNVAPCLYTDKRNTIFTADWTNMRSNSGLIDKQSCSVFNKMVKISKNKLGYLACSKLSKHFIILLLS